MMRIMAATVLIIGVASVLGAYMLRVHEKPGKVPEIIGTATEATSTVAGMPAPQGMPMSLPLVDTPDGRRKYENTYYKFSLIYPKELQMQEYEEEDGARTIIFENPKTLQGFQIFITPYGSSAVTQERFNLDVPSGIYKLPTDVIVDGTAATMFFSENMVMGETREVWFIKNGFLYEVTTYKPLDQWLGAIMRTWKFL